MSKDFTSKIFKIYKESPYRFHLAVLYISVLIVYWQVNKFEFLIGWDDQWYITNHYTENGFSRKNLYAILTDFFYGQYAPVNQFYYLLLYNLFGYSPKYFHISSVLLHLGNATLIYWMIKNVAIKISNIGATRSGEVAFITTLLFAVSPFNLEPVAWVAASKVLLYSLFYLLAIRSYCLYLDTSKSTHFYLVILWFTLSFGAKEQAVSLPICLLLFDYIYKRNFRDHMIWYEKTPLLVLTILFGIVTLQSQGEIILENTHFYPIYQRVILSFYTLSEYFTKAIIPINVSYLYPFPFQVGEPVPLWIYLYPLSTVLIIICLYKIILKKWLAFGLLFFLIHITLVLNLLSLARYSVIADRYAYLSTIGLYFILAYSFTLLCQTKYKQIVVTISFVYFLGFMVSSFNHVSTWRDVGTLKSRIKKVMKSRKDYQNWKNKQNSK